MPLLARAASPARAWSRSCSALATLTVWAIALTGEAKGEPPLTGARVVHSSTVRPTHYRPPAPMLNSTGVLNITMDASESVYRPLCLNATLPLNSTNNEYKKNKLQGQFAWI